MLLALGLNAKSQHDLSVVSTVALQQETPACVCVFAEDVNVKNSSNADIIFLVYLVAFSNYPSLEKQG